MQADNGQRIEYIETQAALEDSCRHWLTLSVIALDTEFMRTNTFYPKLGLGWWEDSPNYVKYAINTNQKFMTFTSLEPIFCHYAKNHDSSQPGEKDNTFLYEAAACRLSNTRICASEGFRRCRGPRPARCCPVMA